MFAEVIIPLALPKNYTWAVPEHLLEQVKPGVRVEVGLKQTKRYAGVVKRIHDERPEFFEAKDILNVLDAEPIVYPEQLKLWEWIARYYMCSEGEVMAAALPSHFKLSSETQLVFNEEYGENFDQLDHDEYLVGEALLLKKELKIGEVQQLLDSSHVYPVIKRLIDKKVCFVWEALKETYTPKKETFVLLNPVYDNEDELAKLLNEDKKLQRAEKQMELLLSYLHLMKTEGEVSKPQLLKKSNATDAQLKGLVDKHILFLEKRHVDRLMYLPRNINIDFTLTPAQQTALEAVQASLVEKPVCLLHGVTSSGKTQVYIKLIEQFVRKGKQVLYLLPEIALTSQIIRRLQRHFGGYIGIYHSKFNQNERLEIWNKVKNGELKIVLGARSSLFLPFSDLGLIVGDEEHDASYKQQDPAPRYHARDGAVYYASLFNARVLLGSATPSVESYYNAQTQKYGFVTLNERFGGVQLPIINIIDTKKILRPDRDKVIISPELQAAIENTLQKNKQVILFQNRRGYSPYQICQACGWIPQCKYCDVSLTFHKNTNKLHCHYCGTVYPPVYTCMACGSDRFLTRNFGTEKIEEQLEEMFPKYRIARMDVDSVKGKTAHDSLIQQFEQQKLDMLVGTQMVVKGLDFEHVELVGILDADSLLSFADFRVNERAFQLMEQVSGRAGRKDTQGHVMIQVSNTRHPVLGYVQQHDYHSFYLHEIEGRKQFAYPPFSRCILLTFKHYVKDVADAAANSVAASLKTAFGNYLVGPAEPVVNRIRNQYLMELLIKLPREAQIIQHCKQQIQEQIAILHNHQYFKKVVVIVDVDTM
ncbi:primosomal protein N' [Paraflavitalea soli]|uniref:Replication restart protein PriA n=1 Tax=Paraflavitalea soli TaxID=2315862 RepID=A0A3B7MHT9_9BACT|nr:primosomal protein N' [Paraflavitalea soli]AXY73974.1 primosomal protein N' [Paraflavitalea soli]